MRDLQEAPPQIADYELIRVIGRGSYGDVWLSKAVTGSYRAVKVVWANRFDDPRPYAREFEGITQFAALSIKEPSQLAVLHAGRKDDFFFYVMELADDVVLGREIVPESYKPLTLEELHERRSQWEVEEVVTLGVALARAVASLHAANLVHRDIKPSNIIFVGGVPKLADVGLVAAAGSGKTYVGTEGYIPPEGPGAPSADVYGLGKVLYELATGLDRKDFPLLPANLEEWKDRGRFLELNEIILRACEGDATQRFPDAGALLEELLLLQAGKSVRRLRMAERRTAMALRIAAVLAVAALLAGGVALLQRDLKQRAVYQFNDLTQKTYYSATLAKAQHALEAEDLGQARRLLKQLVPRNNSPDLRAFEWSALWQEAQGDAADILRDQGSSVDKMYASPDGHYFADQTANAALTLWDAHTKQVVRTILGVRQFAGFSTDGQWLIGLSQAGTLTRWKVGTGEADPASPLSCNGAMLSVGANAALCYKLSGQPGGPLTLVMWDFDRKAERWSQTLPPGADGKWWTIFPAGGVAASANGRYCAVPLIKGRKFEAEWSLVVFDSQTGAIRWNESAPQRFSAVAFSHSGKFLAYAFGESAEAKLYDLESNTVRWRAPNGTGQTSAISFSDDDQWMALAGRSGQVRILTVQSGEVKHSLRGHEGSVESMVWLPGNDAPLIGTSAGEIRLLSLGRAGQRRDLEGGPQDSGYGQFLALSPSGKEIAANSSGHSVRVTTLEDPSHPLEIEGAFVPLYFSENEDELTAVDREGRFQTWQLRPTIRLLESHPLFETPSSTACAEVAPQGAIAVIGNNSGKLALWDLRTKQLKHSFQAHRGDIWWALLTPDGTRAISYGKDYRLVVWDTTTGSKITEWSESIPPEVAAISSDGKLLAVAGRTGEIKLYDLGNYALVHSLETDLAYINSMVFTPDGKRLMVGAQNGELHLYATDDWRDVALMTVPAAKTEQRETVIHALAINREANVVAAALNYGRIHWWSSTSEMGAVSRK